MVVNRPPDYSQCCTGKKTQKGLGKSVVKIYECKSYNKREKEHTSFIILKMLTLKNICLETKRFGPSRVVLYLLILVDYSLVPVLLPSLINMSPCVVKL